MSKVWNHRMEKVNFPSKGKHHNIQPICCLDSPFYHQLSSNIVIHISYHRSALPICCIITYHKHIEKYNYYDLFFWKIEKIRKIEKKQEKGISCKKTLNSSKLTRQLTQVHDTSFIVYKRPYCCYMERDPYCIGFPNSTDPS